MMQTKVTLSPKELELVNNAGWILTKNAVIQKVYLLFGELSEVYRSTIEKNELFIDFVKFWCRGCLLRPVLNIYLFYIAYSPTF